MTVEPSALLTDKVAVVTGGGGGIGRGIAEAFAAHGARVVIAEIDGDRAAETEAAIREAGGTAAAEVVDVREADQVDALRAATLDHYGRVDVLVNNVGHYVVRGGSDFVDTTPEQWHEIYRANLEHVFLCSRAFVSAMIEQGDGGSVISLSTVEAFRAIPRMAVYSAFKSGITAFTRSLAIELGSHRIRVNAIAPDLTQSLQVRYDKWVPEEQEHLIPTWVPVGRFGTADDLAGVALFLASDLSAFVTGTTVHADGGSLAAGGWFRREDGSWTNRPVRP
ncbi:MAG TPA: SDR family NAD(P)-dependent oxidoreductase [Acidimicrobiia bacterium]|nr:SDR family NAD(P)-dependent oxidoreductase [Acidimicrobiia bacterium]